MSRVWKMKCKFLNQDKWMNRMTKLTPRKRNYETAILTPPTWQLPLLQKQPLLRKGDKDRTVINKAGNSKDIIALFKRQSDG
jgi:hypothetical protein